MRDGADHDDTAVPPCRHCGRAAKNLRRWGLCWGCYQTPGVRERYVPAWSPPPTACRHCGHSKVNRPRGLCWHCYQIPGVRGRYTSDRPQARRGVGENRMHRLPAEPTVARPGTAEKIRVMRARAVRSESLFHPRDAGLVPPPVPPE